MIKLSPSSIIKPTKASILTMSITHGCDVKQVASGATPEGTQPPVRTLCPNAAAANAAPSPASGMPAANHTSSITLMKPNTLSSNTDRK